MDVQLTGLTGKGAIAQAVEGFVETRGGEDLRTAQQLLAGQILKHKEVVFRAIALHLAGKRCTGTEDFLA
ncbi:hypothetical protein D3C80_1179140 [compost metagenome]